MQSYRSSVSIEHISVPVPVLGSRLLFASFMIVFRVTTTLVSAKTYSYYSLSHNLNRKTITTSVDHGKDTEYSESERHERGRLLEGGGYLSD